MRTAPSVAVVMAVYNNEPHLRLAIDSILGQTFGDFDFHIFDDGSTDSSPEILAAIRDPRVRIHRLPRNEGLSRVRRRILAEVDAEWIAYLGADDIAREDRLEKQVAMLQADPRLVAIGSSVECIDGAGNRIGLRRYPATSEVIRERLPIENCVADPAVLFRRCAAIEAGGYTPGSDGAEDYDLWLRMALRGEIANHTEPLTQYRVHPGQYKAKRTRRQLVMSLRTRAKAIRLGYPLTFRFAITWIAQAGLLLLPPSLVMRLFMLRTIR